MIVDTVGTFDLLHVGHLTLLTHCKIFVIGEDWGSNQHNLDVESYLKAAGKKIIQVSYNPRTSSTKIKQTVIAQSHTGLRAA